MNKAARFLRDWMLPCAIVLGISLYLIYHYTPALHSMGPWLHPVVSEGQRLVIAILLFFQFVKISPHDIKLSRWHIGALLLQTGLFLLLAAAVVYLIFTINTSGSSKKNQPNFDSIGTVTIDKNR